MNSLVSVNDLTRNPTGVTAGSVEEVKLKAAKLLLMLLKQPYDEDEMTEKAKDYVLVRIKDGTTIADDDYLRELRSHDDIALLMPGQSWSSGAAGQQDSSGLLRHCGYQNKTHDNQICSGWLNDHRDKTPSVHLGLGVYRNERHQATSVRFTAATGGQDEVKLSYDLELRGIRMVLCTLVRWGAVFLAWTGKLLMSVSEVLQTHVADD